MEFCKKIYQLTEPTSGICTPQNMSWRMRGTQFHGILDINRSPNLGQTTRPRSFWFSRLAEISAKNEIEPAVELTWQ